MFTRLTDLLPRLQNGDYGEWIIDKENDGSPGHPKQVPFVQYSPAVMDLTDGVYQFMDEHKEMKLARYGDILKEANIWWDFESMTDAEVSALDGRTVVALLVGAVRAERFCDGALLDFCESGSVIKWLRRLEEIETGLQNKEMGPDDEKVP